MIPPSASSNILDRLVATVAKEHVGSTYKCNADEVVIGGEATRPLMWGLEALAFRYQAQIDENHINDWEENSQGGTFGPGRVFHCSNRVPSELDIRAVKTLSSSNGAAVDSRDDKGKEEVGEGNECTARDLTISSCRPYILSCLFPDKNSCRSITAGPRETSSVRDERVHANHDIQHLFNGRMIPTEEGRPWTW